MTRNDALTDAASTETPTNLVGFEILQSHMRACDIEWSLQALVAIRAQKVGLQRLEQLTAGM